MSKRLLRIMGAAVAAGAFSVAPVRGRELSFEERVRAQEAIDRVYYFHQIGAAGRFEDAVLREVLERKVRTYLEQSAALEQLWNTPVTAEMLGRELARMTRGSRMPDRLRELFAALGNDPFLIQECLARPVLVDRLARNFFAYDQRIHDEARQAAEALHEALLNGSINPRMEHPRRTVVDLVLEDGVRGEEDVPRVGGPLAETQPLKLGPNDFELWKKRIPRRPGQPSPLTEDRESFVVRVLLGEQLGELQVATFSVPKRNWDSWWGEVREQFDGRQVRAVASAPPIPPHAVGELHAAGASSSASWEPVHRNVSSTLPCVPDNTWDNGSLEAPDPRVGHTAVWTGSVMIVWGGDGYLGRFSTGGRYDPATDSWASTSSYRAPRIRGGHTAVWTGSAMIVWGGRSGGTYFQDGGRYDPITDAWGAISSSGPSERAGHVAVWTGSVMLIWGGHGYDYSPPGNTGGRYDPVSNTWTFTSTVNAPTEGGGNTAVWSGHLMIVWGGSVLRSGRYDPATDTWTRISGVNAPLTQGFHTVVWTGRVMVVWGGQVSGPPFSLNTGGRYDPDTDTWTPTSTLNAPEARRWHTAVWTGSSMIVWGGFTFVDVNTGGRYDPVTDTWTPTSTVNPPSARSFHTAVWTGSLMIVWGAGPYRGEDPFLSNTGGRYDATTDTWTPTSTGAGPSPRAGHTAVWTGSLMVVWGGSRDSTGGRYDPATDTWKETSIVDAPSPRVGHTAVWTGALMVVWGGYSNSLALNSGGRYDPATDAWTSTSTSDAPSPRHDHTAVWTGSVMVVWGGYAASSVFDSGGRYDPARDTWTSTSTSDAPSPRIDHTAVWTGNVMVVWGGYGNSSVFNSGARYDPATDRWTPTSTANVPSPRYGHTAVWTGHLMIVWGGIVDSSGGRYDPVADSWTPTSIYGAPAGRSFHTAVWTGTLIVVWGGSERFPPYMNGTGGRYNPANDTWTSISTFNAPSPREGHVAVWTGRAMVIWGGGQPFLPLNTGGRYAVGDPPDRDQDGVCDDIDNCPDSANADQLNRDGDARGDACDTCYLDPFDDFDGDAICADVDNCPETANPDQVDADGDTRGDACDICYLDPLDDFDNDTICGDVDNCPGTANPDQADSDGDAQGDACDPCPLDPLNDLDDDDLCADIDACDDSNLNPTVTVEDCDSGVPNQLFADGCTIADLVARCAAGARNHGEFASCVAQLTSDLRNQGTITGRQRGQIQRCAAHSNPKPPSLGVRTGNERRPPSRWD